eukprot:TRINITY_DN1039_c0_g1_i17.p1 TRINITY_DN1039_c0_g1~~TRINITY_DN1039_c0_g1_i17.p1  ORF type:complete len:123 (-),score=25.44 TRINITY_DN1039_c0_g1_i17:493-861(-)
MIYYGGIAKNKYVVADYTVFDDDFSGEFQQLVHIARPDGSIKVSKQDTYTCYIQSNADGYSFGCVVSPLAAAGLPGRFLEELQRKVYQELGHGDEGEGSTAVRLTKLIREVVVMLGWTLIGR